METAPGAPILRGGLLVLQHKGNFNDARQAGRHQCLAKGAMRHGADHELLRVSRHGPTSHEDDKAGDEVALRVSIAVPAKPHASQTGAPPDDAHGGVLPVVLDPGRAPVVLSKGVDAAPGGNDGTVEELLGTPAALHPHLTDDKDDGQENTIGDESAAHDEVRGTLADVLALAEAESGDAAKDHLRPRQHGHRLSDYGVARPDEFPDPAIHALFPVTLEVETQDDLADQEDLQDVGKARVNVATDELAAAMRMAEEEAEKRQYRAECLRRNVPSRLGNLGNCQLRALDGKSTGRALHQGPCRWGR